MSDIRRLRLAVALVPNSENQVPGSQIMIRFFSLTSKNDLTQVKQAYKYNPRKTNIFVGIHSLHANLYRIRSETPHRMEDLCLPKDILTNIFDMLDITTRTSFCLLNRIHFISFQHPNAKQFFGLSYFDKEQWATKEELEIGASEQTVGVCLFLEVSGVRDCLDQILSVLCDVK